jgi:hypothetical protein
MIEIKKSQVADTRTCDYTKVTKEQLLEASKMHIEDVKKGFKFLIEKMTQQYDMHDLTKIAFIDDFYDDFKTGFKKTDWWKTHQAMERHHFNNPEYIDDDVNLIDILDQIVDGVMAGMARSGEYRQEHISKELLEKAYNNTVTLLLGNIKVL